MYSYGGEHVLFEGRYRRHGQETNLVQVEGYDTSNSDLILATSFAWGEIDRVYDRLSRIDDSNIGTVAAAQQRGQALLRQSEMEATGGSILVPVNCGQQIYDVIDITDARAGLNSAKKRVLGITLDYRPRSGEYTQRLWLGAV